MSSDDTLITTLLCRLEKLSADLYFTAFGPGGKQWCGGPNGYFATYLPSQPVEELAGHNVMKVLWVSFGDVTESWFIAYQVKDGTVALRLGTDAPAALRKYINQISSSKVLLGSLRAQLGPNGSFVAWSKTAWACYHVPAPLRARLCQLSSSTREDNGVTMGSILKGPLLNVQWHADGSFYIRRMDIHVAIFNSTVMREAWRNLWPGVAPHEMQPEHHAEIAHIAINAYAPTSENFVMVKKQTPGEEAPFIANFPGEPIHTRMPPPVDRRLQAIEAVPENIPFRWAWSIKSGRPHRDEWELELRKGQRVKVLTEESREWFIAANSKGIKGYVHASWLDFSTRQFYEDPKATWLKYTNDVKQIIATAPTSDFLTMTDYVDMCTAPECRGVKEDPTALGICVHDLTVLLEGSGCFTLQGVKNLRNMWHPDKFAQYCKPEHAGHLKLMAQQLFVLHGVVMEQF